MRKLFSHASHRWEWTSILSFGGDVAWRAAAGALIQVNNLLISLISTWSVNKVVKNEAGAKYSRIQIRFTIRHEVQRQYFWYLWPLRYWLVRQWFIVENALQLSLAGTALGARSYLRILVIRPWDAGSCWVKAITDSIVGNGDVLVCSQDAKLMIEELAVVSGYGRAMNNPYIFTQINFLRNGEIQSASIW